MYTEIYFQLDKNMFMLTAHKTTLHYIIIKWNAIFCPFCWTHTYYTHTIPLHFCPPLSLIASYYSTIYVHTSVCYRLLLCNCILPLIKSNCILIDCTFLPHTPPIPMYLHPQGACYIKIKTISVETFQLICMQCKQKWNWWLLVENTTEDIEQWQKA